MGKTSRKREKDLRNRKKKRGIEREERGEERKRESVGTYTSIQVVIGLTK